MAKFDMAKNSHLIPIKKKILHLYMVKYFSFGILLPCLSLSLQIGMFCKTKFCQSRKNGFCATATVARQPLYANSSILYYAADWEASDIWFALCKVDSNRVIEVMQFCSLNWLIKDERLLGVIQQLPAPNFTQFWPSSPFAWTVVNILDTTTL